MNTETILIVDDSREIVSALSDVLESRGYNTISAHDGRTGLGLALRERPDLVLLDWNLPRLSGFQVLQALREQGFTAPVVLMTIYGSEGVAVQAFRLGVRDYIPKPLRIPETMEAIERALAEDCLRREKEHISRELEQANRQMEQQLMELTTLQAIGQSVTSVLDLDTVLARAVEAACYFADARESALFLIDKDQDVLTLRAHHGINRSRQVGLQIAYATTPLRRAIETEQPLYLDSGQSDYTIKLKSGYLVRSLLFVPLYIQDRPLGLLGVTDKIGANSFLPGDSRLLTSLGTYVVIAIENARLYVAEKDFARAQAVKQMIVTLSHYIMNPLTAINLSNYELTAKQKSGRIVSEDDSLKRNLQVIELNIKEIVAVIKILQDLASPKARTYVGDIEMIDIEDEVRHRVEQVRAQYPELADMMPPPG